MVTHTHTLIREQERAGDGEIGSESLTTGTFYCLRQYLCNLYVLFIACTNNLFAPSCGIIYCVHTVCESNIRYVSEKEMMMLMMEEHFK